jgi:hypothetical protein
MSDKRVIDGAFLYAGQQFFASIMSFWIRVDFLQKTISDSECKLKYNFRKMLNFYEMACHPYKGKGRI